MNSIYKKRLNFTIDGTTENSSARACTFTTLHNTVQTPVFMPVATMAVLRDQDTTDVEDLGFPVLLANTYHLILRPGTDVFNHFNGIHSFMKWPRSILTDSGGFQVYSLPGAVKISEEGAAFRSYLDGNIIMLSPETSIKAQRIINSDVMMAMDQCVPSTSDTTVSKEAMDITARWAERSIAARGDSKQSIFGIVQGACYPDLRKISAQQISSLPFDGFAIGGLAVGETAEERKDITELTASLLPQNYPRYLMGVGTPIDLLEAVHRGVDMFDCILPTAMAQQGVAYTSHGRVDLKRSVYKFSERPLDEKCTCKTCTQYSRAYLHHLVKTGEYFGSNLIGTHNLTFYHNLMNTMRTHILENTFISFYNEEKDKLQVRDEDNPVTPPKAKKRTLPSLGEYETIKHKDGFHSIRHRVSQEVMHSVNDPQEEAQAIYVDQSRFQDRIKDNSTDAIILWDVGLGAGTNAMTALLKFDTLYKNNPFDKKLQIISFENDLDSFRLAAANGILFPHMRHGAPTRLLKNKTWQSSDAHIDWKLLEGDFVEMMNHAEIPDIIYYDPFSFQTNSHLWTYDLFKKLYDLCKNKEVSLFTYSSSTMVRAALLASGFFVSPGTGSGPKAETTIAFTKKGIFSDNMKMLDHQWLRRFERSTSKFKEDSPNEEKEEIYDKVTSHVQFAKQTII